MESLRSTWTDERLDDFKDRVDSRFDEVSERIGELSGRVDQLSGRVDGLQQAMTQGFITMTAVMVTGFMGLAGLIIATL